MLEQLLALHPQSNHHIDTWDDYSNAAAIMTATPRLPAYIELSDEAAPWMLGEMGEVVDEAPLGLEVTAPVPTAPAAPVDCGMVAL